MNLKHLPIALDTKSIQDDGTFEGYASVFGNVDAASDVVAPGAFAATLRSGRRVKMLWQHDPAVPIGRWTRLVEDSRGLLARGQILREIARGNEIYALMKAEAVDGLSIGFRTRADDLNLATGVRTLKEVDLFEISIVTFPANDRATIAALKAGFDLQRLEAEFAAAGLEAPEAAAAVAVVRRSLDGGEPSEAAAVLRALRHATATLGG